MSPADLIPAVATFGQTVTAKTSGSKGGIVIWISRNCGLVRDGCTSVGMLAIVFLLPKTILPSLPVLRFCFISRETLCNPTDSSSQCLLPCRCTSCPCFP